MRLVFISDLHLSPQTIQKNELFCQRLAEWKGKIDGLYILGDFFDYWLGDDDDNPFTRQMQEQLLSFSHSAPIYFRGGNHDFALGKKYAQRAGMQLIPDMTTLRYQEQTILLSHGDTFCTLDLGYQKMKKILQNPLVMFILRRIPLTLRYKLKEMLENKSHSQHNTKPDATYQVVESSMLTYARHTQAQIIIHGHTHRPGRYSLTATDGTTITRFELPDWCEHGPGGYLYLDETGIKICE